MRYTSAPPHLAHTFVPGGAVHPQARFAMTHRDPLQVLASIAKMTLTLRRTRYDAADPLRVGQQGAVGVLFLKLRGRAVDRRLIGQRQRGLRSAQ